MPFKYANRVQMTLTNSPGTEASNKRTFFNAHWVGQFG